MRIKTRLAEERDIPQIKKIADVDKRWLGFISRAWMGASITQEELRVAVVGTTVAGFVRYHKRRDGVVTVYEICVAQAFRRRGLGKHLICALGDNYLRLKCHQNNPACGFYKSLGFEVAGTFTSKGGKVMNIFERNNVPF